MTNARVTSISDMIRMPFDAFRETVAPPVTPLRSSLSSFYTLTQRTSRISRDHAALDPSEERRRVFWQSGGLFAPDIPYVMGLEDGDEEEDPSLSYEALSELDSRNVPRRGFTRAELQQLRRSRRLPVGAECPISREGFREGEKGVRLPCDCVDVWFKEAPLERWLATSRTCPVCRKEL